MALTKLNNQSLSAVTSAGLPTGSVLQVVYAETSSSNVSMLNTGWTAIGLTALITPSSTSNKILVDFTPQFKSTFCNLII